MNDNHHVLGVVSATVKTENSSSRFGNPGYRGICSCGFASTHLEQADVLTDLLVHLTAPKPKAKAKPPKVLVYRHPDQEAARRIFDKNIFWARTHPENKGPLYLWRCPACGRGRIDRGYPQWFAFREATHHTRVCPARERQQP